VKAIWRGGTRRIPVPESAEKHNPFLLEPAEAHPEHVASIAAL
jgi:hypothetical protein